MKMTENILEYDIVIVGSGAGGGTVAKELAPLCAHGARIALLEWGGHFEKKDNTRREIEMAEKYYFKRGAYQTESQDMTLAMAHAVGGSTTVYTGTSIDIPESVLEKWNIPGINIQDLKPRLEKYHEENNVHLLPSEEINDNNHLFVKGCTKLGWSVNQFPVNVKGCVGLGTCNLGCAVHAKQGVAVVQIPMAEEMGVDVIPFCRVNKIDDHDVIAEVVPPEHGLAPSSLAIGAYRFRTKKIVVAAGAIHSPAIFYRSYGSELSDALGRYFTCHPAMMLAGQHPHPIQNTEGHPKSFYCDEFFDCGRFLLETCMYFPFTFAKSLAGFGHELDDFISHFDCLQMILLLAIDKAEHHNRIEIDAMGIPHIHYRFHRDTQKALVDGCRASARILLAAGAKRVHTPAMQKFFITKNQVDQIDEVIGQKHFKLGQASISAAHLMGGCRMGEDSKTSATNSWGKVHGHDDVYVADASLFPAASEVNPYLTIMALADRVAEGIRRDLGVTS